MAWTEERRQRQAATIAAKKSDKIMSTGVGESRPFVAPEGTFDENPVLNCHVGGVLVRDLPMDAQNRILYRQTDEGIAEFNAGKSETRVSVGDPIAKACAERKDDLMDRGMEPYEAKDPLREVSQSHAVPGMRNKFLSPEVIKKRGMRGFEPVIADGEPVKVGNMILGQMPEEKANARNEYYRQQGEERLKEVKRQYLQGSQGGGAAAVADEFSR